MDQVEHAKLLAALLGVLKKENSKIKDDLLKELHEELDNMTGTKYVQVDEQSEPVPVAVVKGEKGDPGRAGRDGTDGRDGKDGERGSRGPKGLRGLQGPEGKQGKPGKDGKDGVDGETPDITPIEEKFQKMYETFSGQVSSQITRMAYAKGGGGSSGSGEVRLLRLDDVESSSLTSDGSDGNQKYLRYNSTTQKLEFADIYSSINSSLIPSANVTYDLGSESNRWRTLYLSGNTIVLGDATISSVGDIIDLPAGSALGGFNLQSLIDDRMQVANVQSLVTTSINNVLDGAPAALDTLNELAAAIGDDADFITSINSNITQKANTTQLTQYLQVSNSTSFLVQSDVDQYLQVANSFSGSYNDLTDKPNLNQYLQVANVTAHIANTSTTSASLSNSIITFTRADNSTYTLNVSSIQGEVSNSYLTSSYTTNTVFQSYVSNTNSRFSKYLEAANNKTLVAGENVTLSENATSILISTSGGSANVNVDPYLEVANSLNFVDTIQNEGTGTSLVFSKINNLVKLKTIKAGPNITLSETNGELTIAATGELSVTDSLDFGFVDNDFGLITEIDETDSQYDFGTI